MKIINNIQELDRALQNENAEIVFHVWENNNDLPSYNIENLQSEASNLWNYVNSSDNYVPAYYGCGLLSRALSIAQDYGYIIPALFFIICGYDNETAIELAQTRWY